MDLQLQIVPAGDTTARELSEISLELYNILEHLPGVQSIYRNNTAAPAHAKSSFVAAVGSFIITVAPTVLQGLFETLRSVLSRQPAMTKIIIETKDGKVNIEFDPKKIELEELIAAAERLRAPLSPH